MAKNVNIKINADSKNAESGLNKVTSQINKFSKSVKTSSVTKLNASLNVAKMAFQVVTKAVGEAVKVIGELNEAALKQISAEKQLEVSAKNNPYLNKESVTNLKKFASELQNLGTIGDEELLPMMAQLASAGRTQEEIQSIMSAALDVSASGAMSLDSAVKSLNQTYSGTTGRLGKTIPQVKSLTAEELKSGKAVEIVANQYKGMAKEVTNAAGRGKQLKNAWGDLMEQIGMGATVLIAPLQKFFTWAITNVTNLIAGMNNILGITDATGLNSNIKESDSIQAEINEKADELLKTQTAIKNIEQTINDIKNEGKKLATDELSAQEKLARLEELKGKGRKERTDAENEELKSLRREEKLLRSMVEDEKYLSQNAGMVDDASKIEAAEKELNQLREKEKVLIEDVTSKQKDYNSAREKEIALAKENAIAAVYTPNQSALEKQLEQIERKYELEKKVNGSVDERAYHQERLNAMEESYLALLNDESGAIEADSPLLQKRLNDILAEDEALKSKCETEQEYIEIVKKYSKQKIGSELDSLKSDIEALKQYKDALVDAGESGSEAFDKCEEAIQAAQDALNNMEFSIVMSKLQSVVDTIVSSMENLNNSINSIAETAISQNEREADEELDNIKTQYEAGEISYEEYLDKKHELDKKAAQEEYRIKLAQWRMNLAMATAQAAQAVVNALASGTPPVNILNAVSAGLLGAANVATVAGNKPVAPSFSTGGFLTGNSYSGDKIAFMGNAGEAILNPAEQRTFMQMANGEYKGGVNLSMPINIENYASDTVEVSATQDEHMLILTVNKIVKEGLASGTYSTELAQANNSINGDVYL